jgi:hypothetical protein
MTHIAEGLYRDFHFRLSRFVTFYGKLIVAVGMDALVKEALCILHALNRRIPEMLTKVSSDRIFAVRISHDGRCQRHKVKGYWDQ